MVVLVYLGHPAHFHLFKETIKNLQAKSHKVVIIINNLETTLHNANSPSNTSRNNLIT